MALGPYLFNIRMAVITEDDREEAPIDMLFADDIVLLEETRDGLERSWRDGEVPWKQKDLRSVGRKQSTWFVIQTTRESIFNCRGK